MGPIFWPRCQGQEPSCWKLCYNSISSHSTLHNVLFVQYDGPVSWSKKTISHGKNIQNNPEIANLEWRFPQKSCFPSNRASWDRYMLTGISRHKFFDMSQLVRLEGKHTVQTVHCALLYPSLCWNDAEMINTKRQTYELNCTWPRQTDRLTVADKQQLERVQSICRLITSRGIQELMFCLIISTMPMETRGVGRIFF